MAFQEQYSKYGDVGCYLFYGSPKMIIFKQDAITDGYPVTVNEVDVVEVKKNSLMATRDLTIPVEAGQVVANLHMFCVAQILHNIMRSTAIPPSLQAKGLLKG